jgi:hypothetical protein
MPFRPGRSLTIEVSRHAPCHKQPPECLVSARGIVFDQVVAVPNQNDNQGARSDGTFLHLPSMRGEWGT